MACRAKQTHTSQVETYILSLQNQLVCLTAAALCYLVESMGIARVVVKHFWMSVYKTVMSMSNLSSWDYHFVLCKLSYFIATSIVHGGMSLV